MMERIGQFEILEANIRDEVIITQSDKHERLVKVKGIHKNIASITTDLTGMEPVNQKLEKYNEHLDGTSKHKTKLNENLRHESFDVLRINKDLKKILE